MKKNIIFADIEAHKSVTWLFTAAQRTSSCCIAFITVAAVIMLLLSSNADTIFTPESRPFATLGSTLNMSSNADSSSRYASQDRPCKMQYPVALHDSKTAPVCDPRVCIGRDKLGRLEKLPHIKRWSSADEVHYMTLFNTNKMSGWVQVWLT